MFNTTLSKLDQKTILLIGMAREGLSTADFLLRNAPQTQLLATDQKSLSELDPKWSQLAAEYPNLKIINTDQITTAKYDVIIKTPGIPKHILEDNYGLDLAKPITSNTQLFFDVLNGLKEKPVIIGVTGTKGKSTTTSQIYHLLKEAGKNVLLGGNIGLPPLRLLENNAQPETFTYVLEMSSHQLAELTSSPNIAVIQDISPDHLDYYTDFDQYLQAKTPICKFQNENDMVIFNQDSHSATMLAKLSPGKKIGFSLDDSQLIDFIKSSRSPLLGKHNLYNTLPAVIVAETMGIDHNTMASAIASFKPVPHRLELVGTVDQVKFYNDSAASAPGATEAAINAFEGAPLVLIAGGSDKGVSFADLAKTILQENVKKLVLFPTTGEKILNSIKNTDPNHPLVKSAQFASSMDEAVNLSRQAAAAGDTILLSPGSASFNMFKSYEDRGNQFRDLVQKIST